MNVGFAVASLFLLQTEGGGEFVFQLVILHVFPAALVDVPRKGTEEKQKHNAEGQQIDYKVARSCGGDPS